MSTTIASNVRHDARALPFPGLNEVSAPKQVMSLPSMSESLAHGLVSRLTKGANELAMALAGRTEEPRSRKRAACFRQAKDYVRKLVPAHLQALEMQRGDGTGKDKNAHFILAHWDSARSLSMDGEIPGQYTEDDLVLQCTSVDARHVRVVSVPVMAVSRHALMRLFMRMKTTDETLVLGELGHLVSALLSHTSILTQLGAEAQLLVPSPSGAFVVTRNHNRKRELYVKTWMSDARMVDNRFRQAAVAAARTDSGFVMNAVGAFPILSDKRLAEVSKLKLTSATYDVLNTLCDSAFPEHTRLQAEWRFVPAETWMGSQRL